MLTFDFANAQMTLALLEPNGDLPRAESAWESLPATQAVLEKVKGREPASTLESMLKSLQQEKAGVPNADDAFRWGRVSRKRAEISHLLQRLETDQDAIRSRLAQKLGRMLSPDQTLSVTVHFIVGSPAAGWATDPHNLYVGLHFYDGDENGVVYTVQHELFHNLQFLCYPHEKSDLQKLSPRQQEVYSLLESLFMEGTATYFSDVEDFAPGGPFIQKMLAPKRDNDDRMLVDFLLLDTLLYRLSRDGTVSFADLYPLGFDWSWQNPLYYAGYAMCKALVRAHGPDYLKRSLTANPVQFAADYCDLTRTQKEADALPALSPDSVQTIRETLKALRKP